jgi:hypothetical protein
MKSTADYPKIAYSWTYGFPARSQDDSLDITKEQSKEIKKQLTRINRFLSQELTVGKEALEAMGRKQANALLAIFEEEYQSILEAWRKSLKGRKVSIRANGTTVKTTIQNIDEEPSEKQRAFLRHLLGANHVEGFSDYFHHALSKDQFSEIISAIVGENRTNRYQDDDEEEDYTPSPKRRRKSKKSKNSGCGCGLLLLLGFILYCLWVAYRG